MLSVLVEAAWPYHRHYRHGDRVLGQPSPYERNFTQLVDHFSPFNTTTFNNRYYLNTEFYTRNKSDLLVLDIGGEAENTETSVNGKYSSYYFAEHMKGLLASLEHRFYGASNFEKSNSDLQYLTSSQALADYAEFIPYLKAEYNVSKVLVVGGSYSASLAGWLRIELPHLVDAAIVSSGPLVAVQNYSLYLEHVQNQINSDYWGQLKMTYEYMENLTWSNNYSEICSIFGISTCQFGTDLDKINLLECLIDPIAGLVEYNKAANYSGENTSSDIAVFVKKIKACKSLQEIMRVLAEYCDFSDFQHYDEMIAAFQVPGTDDGRLWTYQTCNEFAFFESADYDASIFPKSVTTDFFVQICLDAFYKPMGLAQTLDQARELNQHIINTTNWQRYGSLNAPRDHIYYTAGAVDPWTELAMQDFGWDKGQFRPEGTESKLISWGSHCSDLYISWTINDEIRVDQLEKLKEWLEE